MTDEEKEELKLAVHNLNHQIGRIAEALGMPKESPIEDIVEWARIMRSAD